MQTIRVLEKTGKDGTLCLRIPLGKPEAEYEVLVVLQPKTAASTPEDAVGHRGISRKPLAPLTTKPSCGRRKGDCQSPWSSIDVSARYQRRHSVFAWQERADPPAPGRLPDLRGSPVRGGPVRVIPRRAAKCGRPRIERTYQFAAPFTSLPFDDAAADVCSRIRHHLESQGTPIGPYDLQIAAIALANGCTLVRHNTAEFRRVPGLLVEDWETP